MTASQPAAKVARTEPAPSQTSNVTVVTTEAPAVPAQPVTYHPPAPVAAHTYPPPTAYPPPQVYISQLFLFFYVSCEILMALYLK